MSEDINILDSLIDCNRNIVPEAERPGRRYRDEEQLGPRPRREKLREQVADYVMLKLGAPVIDLELTTEQLSLCVDESLAVFEEYAPASMYQYYTFQTSYGQSRYRMPVDVGLIRQVYWRTEGSNCDSSTNALEGAVPLPFLNDAMTDSTGYFAGFTPGAPVYGRAGEWVLTKQYNEMYQRLSSGNGGWEWGPENELILYPNPRGHEWVIVHYLQRMKDWPSVYTWMQEYALAHAKEILGRIRSVYNTVPGPNGGLSLDGPTLLAEAQVDFERLRQEAMDKYGIDHFFIITG